MHRLYSLRPQPSRTQKEFTYKEVRRLYVPRKQKTLLTKNTKKSKAIAIKALMSFGVTSAAITTYLALTLCTKETKDSTYKDLYLPTSRKCKDFFFEILKDHE